MQQSHYNAKVLSDAACRIAGYVGGETPLVYISGADRQCPGYNVLLSAEIEGVPAPCIHKWYVSDDGFDWGDPVSEGNFITITMPLQLGQVVFVMLVAGNENGPMETAFFSVMSDTTDLNCGEYWYVRPGRSVEAFTAMRAFPNPVAGDFLTLQWPVMTGNNGSYKIDIFDSFGRLLSGFSRQIIEEQNEISLNVSHLPNGSYSLRLQISSYDSTIRFVVLR